MHITSVSHISSNWPVEKSGLFGVSNPPNWPSKNDNMPSGKDRDNNPSKGK
jgi:hypothetical protein